MSGPSPSVLFIRHDQDAHPGVVGTRLVERGFEANDLFIAPSHTETNPVIDFGDPGRFDLIVALGSVFSVYDTAAIGNWIGNELQFLADAHDRDIPILGICFGGQALAAALGATVEAAPVPEIGWLEVDSDRPEVLAPGPWMQWHYDRFAVPDGATEIASSPIGPQAFTVGRSLGLQFHPEVSAEIVNSWLDGAPAGELTKPGVDVGKIRTDTNRLAPEAKPRTEQLVDWFIDDIAKL